MATHKSAEKRARQSLKRRARNQSSKSKLKSFEKALRQAITKKDSKAAGDALKIVTSQLDKAANKGIIHARKAARKISQLSKSVVTLVQG